jgi:putative oxidoreductase
MTSLLHKAPHLARYLLGTIFFVFGLNGFFHFLPQPPMSGPPAEFAQALVASGYVFPVLKGAEVVAGVFLLSNRFVPLALALLAPAVVGIVGFHLVLAPAGMAIALLVLVLELYLAWSYRSAFAPMLRAHNEPARSEVFVAAQRAA